MLWKALFLQIMIIFFVKQVVVNIFWKLFQKYRDVILNGLLT